jgi:hypothetical protein
LLNAAFATETLDLISRVHLPSFVNMLELGREYLFAKSTLFMNFILVRCIPVVFNNTLNEIYRWNITFNTTLCRLY